MVFLGNEAINWVLFFLMAIVKDLSNFKSNL